MQQISVPGIPEALPPAISRHILDAPVFDSSCSDAARVWFIAQNEGIYLKSAPAGALRREAALTGYFHSLALAPRVIAYESGARDYMLTARVPGRDCLDETYLSDPPRLCDTLGEILRHLHDTPAPGCPVTLEAPDLALIGKNGLPPFHSDLFLGHNPFPTPQASWDLLLENAPALGPEVLIHGDFCLPNVILQNWNFSGLIDLGGAGLGSRYTDLFWGLWSLCYNLKTPQYSDRFLDAYGRDRIDRNLLLAAAALEGFL